MIQRRDGPPTMSPQGSMRPRSPSEALEPTRAPQRPRGGKIRQPSRVLSTIARIGSAIITLSVVALVVIGGLALLLGHFYERPGPLIEARSVVIEKGAGRIEIAEQLERDGIISSRWAFVANHLLRNVMSGGKPVEMKAGEYEIKAAASMRDVLELLGEGKSVLYKVTLPEGLTSQQIVERLLAEPNLSGEITQIPPEGSLLPDTYRVSKGMSRQELLGRMQAESAEFLARAWEKRAADLPVATPREALILASIVEKETGKADERQRVAAVFVNRLKKKMRLQSDPTIIYGIVGGRGSLGRSITRSDIDTKTDYNTYRINGLPPGPICNPGRETIEATLNPAVTNDLYFVADGTGGHTFSETLAAHNAAVQNWRKIEKTQAGQERNAGPGVAEEGDVVGAAGEAGSTDAAAAPEAGAAAAAVTAAPAVAAPPAPAKKSNIPLPVRKPKTP
ncbi:MAG: endolytic transglycosylase MltG [Hyphomicrobium sp.]|nr:endolytic transglycosylase MltG [Hyphomicrobium sp.]PPD08295.1 MAG: aminodeoxychorismate lyase [Hyphomicrobium sp.]